MAGFIGADPEELRSLASAFGGAGARLEATASEVSGAFGRTTWVGYDAERFGQDWQSRIGPVLRSAAETLREQGELLRAEALQQEQASSADGAGGSSGGGDGKASAEAPVDQDANDAALAEHAEDGDPEATAEWWQSLPEEEQDRLANDFPDLVGNLEGADYDDRHTANVIRLDRDLEAAQERGDDDIVEALEAVRDTLEAGTDAVPYQLISYEAATTETFLGFERTTVPPLAAISLGDLDAADYATYLVPGMNSELSGIGGLVSAGDNLRAEQGFQMREQGLSGDTAVVAWMGYETPGFHNVTFMDRAKEGGTRLEQALLGYDARLGASGGESILNVSAHSYGSTTAGEALRGMPDGVVDNLITVGSAGLSDGIDGAGGLAADDVYAIMGDEHVAGLGRNLSGRQDPRDADFGAINISSEAEGSGSTGYHPTTEHDMTTGGGDEWYGYYDPRTTSVRNQALITLGLGDEASRG